MKPNSKSIDSKFDAKPEFDQKLVELRRVARVVKGGKRFRFRATVVIGDRNGKVGAGMGKGTDVSTAVEKAVESAKKKMIKVVASKDTIPHEIMVKKGGAIVLLRPAPTGTGVIAGGAVRSVVELAGIKNILSKIIGSDNQTNNVLATIEALKKLRDPNQIMLLRNKSKPKVQNVK